MGGTESTHWATRGSPERKAFLTALASCSAREHSPVLLGLGVHASRSRRERGGGAGLAAFCSFRLLPLSRGPAGGRVPQLRLFLNSWSRRACLFHLQACLSVVQLTGSVRKPLNNGWDLRKPFGWVWAPLLLCDVPALLPGAHALITQYSTYCAFLPLPKFLPPNVLPCWLGRLSRAQFRSGSPPGIPQLDTQVLWPPCTFHLTSASSL